MRSRRIPRVVDQHVEAIPPPDGGFDQTLGTLPVSDVVAVGDRLAAGGADLVHDIAGRTVGTAPAVDLSTQVVDDHPGALAGQLGA